MKKFLLSAIIIIFLISCISFSHYRFDSLAVYPKTDQPSINEIIKIMSDLEYPIQMRDDKAGVINTGWYYFTVIRGMLQVSWNLRSRAIITTEPDKSLNLKFFVQYDSGFSNYNPIFKEDLESIAAGEKEYNRIKNALSKKFRIKIKKIIQEKT